MSRAEAKERKKSLKQKTDDLKANVDLQKKQLRPTILPLKVLSDKTISFKDLKKDWKGIDTRKDAERHLIEFININSPVFKFLGITPQLSHDMNGASAIQFTTSKYAGCVPLLSPGTGMPYGELIVEGLYGENLSELISVIKEDLKIEYDERFQINTVNTVKPPLYLECQKFVDKYIEAKRYRWRKFKNVEMTQLFPNASTRWDKYAVRDIDPWSALKYPNRNNILTCDHEEWNALTYILHLSIIEIMKPSTPLRSKAPYLTKISLLSKQYYVNRLKPVTSIPIRTSDPAIIKGTKEIGMRILQNNVSSKRAWRIDYSEFFERYVQYVLKLVAGLKGARLENNKKYRISGDKTAWTLSYLEPDAVMYKDGVQYIIDAKYKSHMYNVNRMGEELKDTFREDFHQVLAYSSFGGNIQKYVMLIYPSEHFISRELCIRSSINGYSAKAYLVGIPLKKSDLEDTKMNLSELINFNFSPLATPNSNR